MAVLPNPPLAINADNGAPAYSGEAFRVALSGLLLQGSTVGVARSGVLGVEHLKVSISGSSVVAAGGGGVIGSASGAYVVGLASALTVGELETADATNPRVDRVVLRVDDPSTGGTTARTGAIELVTGTPAASPLVPAVRDTTTFIELATISVPRAGSGNPAVTDKRVVTAAAGGIVSLPKLSGWAPPDGTVGYSQQDSVLYLRTGGAWSKVQQAQTTTTVSVSMDSGFSGKVILTKTGNLVTARTDGQITGTIPVGATILATAKIPAAYRPGSTVIGSGLFSSSQTGAVTFGANGNVQCFHTAPSDRTWVQGSGVWTV